MRLPAFLVLFFISLFGYSQNKDYYFYNEEGRPISRKDFYKTRYNRDNFPVYLENDTARFGILYHYETYGKLNDSSYRYLRKYLGELKQTIIDSSDFIVINYLTSVPDEEQKRGGTRTTWNIFDRNYTGKLKRMDDVSHFWISSLEKQNLKYFYSRRIDWLTDKKGVIPELFFPFEFTYGYFVIINPEGEYYYHLGEYAKQFVWEKTEQFVKGDMSKKN